MRELKIAVIDDDYFKREHMAQELDRSPHIAVVHAIDQDEATRWTDDRWVELDFVLVDVFDEYAPGEVGTDLYSGVAALDRLRNVDVRTIAITPHRHHPLVEHRIFQAEADFLYRRWEVNDLEHLEAVLLRPDMQHRPKPVDPQELARYGAARARTNVAVSSYVASPLHGRLRGGMTKRALQLPRRTIDGFLTQIERTGFDGPPRRSRARDTFETGTNRVHWKHVRDYLLVLIGRKDSPPSSTDRQDV